MHTHAQQEPSVAVIFVSIYSDALVVYLLRLPAVALFGESFQVGYDFFAVGFEIFKVYLEPALKLLRRLFEVGNEAPPLFLSRAAFIISFVTRYAPSSR